MSRLSFMTQNHEKISMSIRHVEKSKVLKTQNRLKSNFSEELMLVNKITQNMVKVCTKETKDWTQWDVMAGLHLPNSLVWMLNETIALV